MEDKKWFIIDGNSLIYRTFYALPPLTNSKGIHTNAVFGFASILMKIIDEEKPDYIGVAFDKRTPTFRHKDYKEYKAGRLRMPEELAEQFPILFDMLEALGVERISLEGYEADDLIGTLSKHGEQQGIKVKIVTGDRDAFQLASDETTVWYTKKGISQLDKMDRQAVTDQYGVTPYELIDVKGLMGDKSDNIPGVPGVGEKTAIKLIQKYKTLEGVYENIEDISQKALNKNLTTYKEQAILSKKLATIVRDIPLEVDLEQYKLQNPYNENLIELFKQLEFSSLLAKMGLEGAVEEDIEKKQLKHTNISTHGDLKKLKEQIQSSKSLYLQWLLDGADHRKRKLQSLAVGTEEELFFIDFEKLDTHTVLQEFKTIFESEEIKKIGHDMKEWITFLLLHDIQLKGLAFDSYIAAYILDPSDAKYDLHLLAAKYLKSQILSEEQLLGKGKKAKLYGDLRAQEKCDFILAEVDVIINIYDKLKTEIEKQKMTSLYYDIELPLIYVLADMENTGFHVEKAELEKLSKEFGESIEGLTKEIHDLAGEEFNINSPKQLSHILFDVLELPVIKKTKTGYSTNIEVLERLKDKHPIIEKVIDIRQISKLKSTYVDGLMSIIDEETQNIHSSFNQTIASTGRISSSEPNLQNIPIKTEMGRRIRKVFVGEKAENYLVDADYSQIELRILAHISQDENLLQAFNKGQDVHTQTASQVFDVAMEDVSPTMRNRAKAVNFGIVYGISDYGLSRDLKIPRKEAKEYIDNYKKKYFGVKEYMDEIIVSAKEKGYVTTIFGRKRPIPEIYSKNANIRSFGERLALNTPIQGAAADIIKIAMVQVHKRLGEQKMISKLILQVHDELIVEAVEEELQEVQDILIEEMEKAAQLSVKLKVDIAYGKSWYHTK